MAAFVKSKLKAARDALGKKDFNSALAASREVLSLDSKNYNACVPIKFGSTKICIERALLQSSLLWSRPL